MSTGGAILLPLDSYGGIGARGRSGASNSLHPLASEGAAYHHSSGEIILPALTATFTVTKGPSFSLDRPLPRHISDDDEIYASDDEDTDPTAQVQPEAEISDDPSSTDDELAEEDDYDEIAERNYSDYIEMIQRNRWQGDE
jgi:hypothetical protein